MRGENVGRAWLWSSCVALSCGLTWAAGGTDCLADDSEPPAGSAKPAEPQPLSAEQIAGWIGQLDDSDFAIREAASRELIAGGEPVVKPVARAAQSDSLETSTRSISILRELFRGSNDDAKKAAESALQDLAGHKNASVARRAKSALTRSRGRPAPDDPAPGRFGFRLPRNRNVGMQAQNINGQVVVRVIEPGRRIEIEHNSGREIVMRDFDTTAGGFNEKMIDEVKADDPLELKEKHPEAYRCYEQYAGAKGIPGKFPDPFGAPVPRGPEADRLQRSSRALDAAMRELTRLRAQIKVLERDADATAGQVDEVQEQIRAALKRLEESLEPRGK